MQHYLYFYSQPEMSRFKIGQTKCIESRVKALTSIWGKADYECSRVLVVPSKASAINIEKALHTSLEPYNKKYTCNKKGGFTEWFCTTGREKADEKIKKLGALVDGSYISKIPSHYGNKVVEKGVATDHNGHLYRTKDYTFESLLPAFYKLCMFGTFIDRSSKEDTFFCKTMFQWYIVDNLCEAEFRKLVSGLKLKDKDFVSFSHYNTCTNRGQVYLHDRDALIVLLSKQNTGRQKEVDWFIIDDTMAAYT